MATLKTPAEAPRRSPPATDPAEKDTGPDLTLQRQHQRKVQLSHEASLLNKAGRTEELKLCLETLLEIDPNDAQALYNLGCLCYQQGEKTKAERLLRQVGKADPDYIDAYQALGDIHFDGRHLLSAIEIYESGLRRVPTRLPLLASLLRASSTMRSPYRVETVARRILNIDDRNTGALNGLAWSLMISGGDLDEARQALSRSAREKANAPATLALQERVAEMLGDTEAAALHRDALDTQCRDQWQSANAAADTFISLGRISRAADIVREYLRENPEDPQAHRYLAVTLMQDGDFHGGQAILEQMLQVVGEKASLQMVYGLNAFRLGDLETFFRFHDTRWTRTGSEELWKGPWPEWDGAPLKSGKLLVQCEQGVGDYVMFAVPFPAVRERVRDVLLKVTGRLHNLFRRSFPDFQIISESTLPFGIPEEAVVARAAAADLVDMLGGDIEHLPGKSGILIADPVAKQKLRKRYEEMFPGKRLIGISWRSGNRDSAATRSLDLPYWKPLFDLPDCAFISLQYGDNTSDLEELKRQLGDMVYWDKEVNPIGDMDPFTAQISAMDLVVSVDNSTVHFAGGLGKPCWAMLPLNSDWRWQVDRTDTVWYDSVELFRPEKESGWDGLIDRVAKRLAELDDATLKAAELAYLRRALSTMMNANRVGDAEQYARMLLMLGEDKPQAMRAIARAASAASRFADAVGILQRAIELDPDDPEIRADFATAVAKAGDVEAGLTLARQLTRQFPKNDSASIACGQILTDLGRYDEATDFFARTLRRDPDNTASRLALAGLQAAQSEFDLALANYRRVVASEPANTTAHTAMSEIHLRLRHWAEGWEAFRWRFAARPGIFPPHLASIDQDRRPKLWVEGNLRRQRLLLTAERNAAEQLLLVSLLPEIAKESRRVVMECDTRLQAILAASFPNIDVVPRAGSTEADIKEKNIQVVSTLGDLAQRLRASSAEFPERARPWLTADPVRSAALREEYRKTAGARRLVGLGWSEEKERRPGSFTPDDWIPLLDRDDITVVALHPGPISATLAEFGERSGRDMILDRRVDFSRDFGDYAAQIAACDFVIAAEDLAATLAGGMGKPTVKLKKPVDHWWWGTGEARSPWFPDLRSIVVSADAQGSVVERVMELVSSSMGAK